MTDSPQPPPKPRPLPPIVIVTCPDCKKVVVKARLPPGGWVQGKCPDCHKLVERAA